jgi:hypothetical protein
MTFFFDERISKSYANFVPTDELLHIIDIVHDFFFNIAYNNSSL